MCLLLIAQDQHPVYRLVLAANRDEYYDRSTKVAAFWEDAPQLLAGRDLKAGGTWLGITLSGKLAALTNYRNPADAKAHAPSRGNLVCEFLKGTEPARSYLGNLSGKPDRYNGFNLIAGSVDELFWYSNRGGKISRLSKGLYGLSNHLLDTPWPKVEKAKDGLKRLLSSGDELKPEDLLTLLQDRRRPPDKDLPQTGVEIAWERILAPIFISSSTYGTRSSTVILVDRKDRVLFTERTFHSGGDDFRDIRYRFRLYPSS
ncbi:MAG: NRDE family protein [Desulfatiglandaceae bacterium]